VDDDPLFEGEGESIIPHVVVTGRVEVIVEIKTRKKRDGVHWILWRVD
jgi:hypothetical protein